MTTFTNAVKNQSARTQNNMKARASTASPTVDLFYGIGASRGKDILPAFVAAYVEDKELAVRIALWARDARGGAGERKLFRDILTYLDKNDPDLAYRVLLKTPELGRWDDMLVVEKNRPYAFTLIKHALEAKHGLAAKWMPRKGPDANALRTFLGWSPKRYRKTLVTLSKTVEQNMCARSWDQITYDHVPSVASARYQKAFFKHDPVRYAEWREGLKTGETKVNASVLYPYDVIKSVHHGDETVALAQWEALPNYVGDANILPIVDVSGSMTCSAGGSKSVTCLDVAVSLGLYLADKNKGKFKDTCLTFSAKPQLLHLQGNLLQKMQQMESSQWEMNTNLNAAFEKILQVALEGKVPQEEMPQTVLILSDMQFDQCVRHDDSAIEMIRRKYEAAGYTIPNVVFWNLNNSYGNAPVAFNESGTALVSGFSPAIMTSILAGKEFTPESIMLETIMKERYDF